MKKINRKMKKILFMILHGRVFSSSCITGWKMLILYVTYSHSRFLLVSTERFDELRKMEE